MQEKSKKSMVAKYGVEHALQSKEIQEKQKKTNLEKYGTENVFKSKIIKDKIKQTKHKKYGSQNHIKYYNIIPNNKSNLEIQFKRFLNQNNIDFICENNSIRFEINNIDPYKDKYYYFNKTIQYKEKGIRLIHLWEWELRDQKLWDRLSNWIINLLNINKIKIGARNCTIKEISIKDEKKFLNQYHLQGYKKSQICLGLYYKNELVMIESFCKPRYNIKYECELLRLCTKFGYSIIGGAKKLLDHFIKKYNPKSIISYCNLDKFTGNIYEKIGFKLLKNIEPQIVWCNKEMKHFNQSSLIWIGADKLIGTNYGKGSNNTEIVIKHGYVPIYNCGLAVYIITTNQKGGSNT